MKPIISKRVTKNGVTYRIIVKYTDEFDKQVTKETRYKPEKNLSEAKAEVYAELYAEKYMNNLLQEVEEKKKQIELDKQFGGPMARMTFRELGKEWLESKYDESNPASINNISYKYYKKAIAVIDEFNEAFGDVRVKDINHEVIYKYYKKLNSTKKVRIIVKAKPNIKDVINSYNLSYRKILSYSKKRSLDIGGIVRGNNITERTAQKFCQSSGIPFKEIFTKEIIEEEYSEYTQYKKKKFLKSIFEFAKNTLRIIDDNPALDPSTKGMHVTKRRESLSEEQAIKFYEATKEFDMMIQTAMHMSLLTGMRPAEMGGLEWRDIDFTFKTITIERNAVECKDLGVIIKGTKTNRSRTISIPQVLVEQLLKYRKWQEEWKEELGDLYKDEGQVFSTPDGNRIITPTFNKWFKKVRDAAGIPSNFTLYNLRHTNLSILVGYVPITTVAQRAGHTTIKTTEEYYIHRVSEADMLASEKLNSVFEKAYSNQKQTEDEKEIQEYKEALEKMKQLGFKTLQEYFEYLNYMKSKGYTYEI